MKIVFFTNKCSHGAELLKQLKNNNIVLTAIFIDDPLPQGLIKKLRKILKRFGVTETVKIIVKSLITMVRSKAPDEWLSNDYYYSYSDDVFIVDNFNGMHCEKLLKDMKPDLIVLGGSRILKENIVTIPRIGILNAHPGLLPKYRGIDVIQWAIYNEDDIGVTVHFVDKGVDTGPIVMQKIIELEENDTFNSLGEKAEIVAGELMAKAVLAIMKDEPVQKAAQLKEDGQQYYKMPAKVFREAKRRLKRRLHERERGHI